MTARWVDLADGKVNVLRHGHGCCTLAAVVFCENGVGAGRHGRVTGDWHKSYVSACPACAVPAVGSGPVFGQVTQMSFSGVKTWPTWRAGANNNKTKSTAKSCPKHCDRHCTKSRKKHKKPKKRERKIHVKREREIGRASERERAMEILLCNGRFRFAHSNLTALFNGLATIPDNAW